MSSARYGHTDTLLPNGKVLVAGGRGQDSQGTLGSAELYDPAAGNWATTGLLTSPREAHTATLLSNGKVMVIGGYDGTNVISTAEVYDPATGTWSSTNSLITARNGHSATLLLNGKVLVAGGHDGSAEFDSAEIYDPLIGTWTPTGSMTYSHWDHTATLLPDGRVLVAGGDGGAAGTSAEIYDPATGTWTGAGDMIYSRTAHTATLLPNGQVLMAGGGWYYFGFLTTSTAELYNPTNGTFIETGEMVSTNSTFPFLATGRHFHTATLLTNGLVLVTGGDGRAGFVGSATLSSAEFYHPDTGVWMAAEGLTVRRTIHTATLMANGHVLIAGGVDWSAPYSERARSNAELHSTVNATPPVLTDVQFAAGAFQFSFTNNPGAGFSVLASTNLALPLSNWTIMGGVTEISSGRFQFRDPNATNFPRRFYQVRSL
ncbi:MAG TPA: kelch repeat-containing protein [Verrucomicrobiae bacterium]|nr:kelch repeat-containing protein [Verrucomicrobiae bacterium]